MARATIVPHEAAIFAYIAPEGEVSDVLNSVAKDTAKHSRIIILKNSTRTGNLAAANRWNRAKPNGPSTGTASAYNNARHALWVHDGTSRIYAKRGYLLVPRRGTLNSTTRGGSAGSNAYKLWVAGDKKGPKGFTRRDSVRGQRGTKFLAKALKVAMAENNLH